MGTAQHLARLGAAAAFVGAVLLIVSTSLHPLDSDPGDAPAAFAEYAADAHYVWSHRGAAGEGTAALAFGGVRGGQSRERPEVRRASLRSTALGLGCGPGLSQRCRG